MKSNAAVGNRGHGWGDPVRKSHETAKGNLFFLPLTFSAPSSAPCGWKPGDTLQGSSFNIRRMGRFRIERQLLKITSTKLFHISVHLPVQFPIHMLFPPVSAGFMPAFKPSLLSLIFSNLLQHNYSRQHLSFPGSLQIPPL